MKLAAGHSRPRPFSCSVVSGFKFCVRQFSENLIEIVEIPDRSGVGLLEEARMLCGDLVQFAALKPAVFLSLGRAPPARLDGVGVGRETLRRIAYEAIWLGWLTTPNGPVKLFLAFESAGERHGFWGHDRRRIARAAYVQFSSQPSVGEKRKRIVSPNFVGHYLPLLGILSRFLGAHRILLGSPGGGAG